MYITDNSRILSREELPTPEEVINEVPLDKESSKLVLVLEGILAEYFMG